MTYPNMRKLLLIILVVLCGQQVYAQRSLVAQTKNGKLTYFSLAQEPRVYFEKDCIQIYYEADYVSILLDDFEGFSYGYGSSNAVGSITNKVGVEEKDGQVVLYGLQEGTPVRLYNSSGVLVARGIVERGKPFTLSLRSLPAGVYVIQNDHQTFKIQKR